MVITRSSAVRLGSYTELTGPKYDRRNSSNNGNRGSGFTAEIARMAGLLGCILLELFWLFLFRFRNNRIHGISISKRTLIHSENGILMVEVT